MTFTLSELHSALAAFDPQALEGLEVVAAARVAAEHYPCLSLDRPVLLIGLAAPSLARGVRETLLAAYPPDHPVTLIGTGSPRTVRLDELATVLAAVSTGALGSAALSPATCLWIPALPMPAEYARLQDVVARLRAPDGCPWDRALTWSKLRPSLLEECYELLAALDAGDGGKVAEELGDLLLEVALVAQIGMEEGRFRLPEVIAGIVEKLIRRHLHVFGDAVVSGTEEVLANWEAIKRAERERNGEKRSPLATIPAGLPALAQADAYLDRMSRLGPLDVAGAIGTAVAKLSDDEAVTPERLGDFLLELVAWARVRGVDAESALRAANARYAARIEAEVG